MTTTRRRFLVNTAGFGSSVLLADGFESLLGLDQQKGADGREFLGVVPLDDRRRRTPVNKPYGSGLEGRLRFNLSALKEGALITPTKHFYIRTRCPKVLDTTKPWKIRVRGLVERERELAFEELLPLSRAQGVHLMECSGSGTGGLISACDWKGIPIDEVLRRCDAKDEATHIKIAGFDGHPPPRRGRRDLRGCDWVFTDKQLRAAGAFLATHMNGERINRDHGFPVRLVVPGWYGCTCVKWLDEITFVDKKQRATPHMIEFAGRTLQKGRPKLAADYRPAQINLSAMTVRVEKWRAKDKIEYDVVGIVWGGRTPAKRMAIRFDRRGPAQNVTDFKHKSTRTWNLWRHTWRPERAGRYWIRCSFPKAGQPTQKVDTGYFDRRIEIDAV